MKKSRRLRNVIAADILKEPNHKEVLIEGNFANTKLQGKRNKQSTQLAFIASNQSLK